MLLQDPGTLAQAVRQAASLQQREGKEGREWLGERILELMSRMLSTQSSEWDRLRERLATLLMGLDVSLQLAFFRHAVDKGGEVSQWARGIGEALPEGVMAQVVAEAMVTLGPSETLKSFLDALVPSHDRRIGLLMEVERKLEEYGVSKEEFLRLLCGEETPLEERLECFLKRSVLTAEDLAHAPDLIRWLYEGGRMSEARRVLGRFFNGLNHPEREVRSQVASQMEEVFEKLREVDPEGRLGIKVRDFVLGKLLHEPDQEIYRRLSEGLEQVAWADIRRGNLKEGVEMLQKVYSALEMSQEDRNYVEARRERMVEALSSEGVLEAAKRDLLEGDQEARKRGMWVFQLLGEQGAELLIEALGQEEQMSRRMRLIQVLVSMGEVAVAPLRRALLDHRWYLVRNAVRILGEIGDPRVVPTLVGLLEHPEERVRKEVVQALGLLGTPKAEEGLFKALEDKEEGVRVKAFEVLPSVGGARARQKVLQILSRSGHRARKEPMAKARALRALAVLGTEDDVDLVSSFLTKRGLFFKMEPEEVRRSAAAALGGILERTGSERAFKALQQALSSDPSPVIQKALQKALESAEGGTPLRH
jgi:HEAT repeat protein